MMRPNRGWVVVLGLCGAGACAHDDPEQFASNEKPGGATGGAPSDADAGVPDSPAGGAGGSGGTNPTEGGPGPDSAIGGSSGSAGASGAGGEGASAGSDAAACVAEICNNLDDDCDGEVDEDLTEACATTCGSGTRVCQAGVWGACSAGEPISCTNFDTCQHESMCVASCPPAPPEVCNARDDDCDGACDEGAGCRAAVLRSYKGSTGEHFYTTSMSEATCCGYVLENSSAYFVYPDEHSGLVPFYTCLLASGMHFYTLSASCEGAPSSTLQGVLGYVATNDVCGSIPLYRLSKSSTGDHLYTTSEGERDNAVQSYGYDYESIAAYVWASE